MSPKIDQSTFLAKVRVEAPELRVPRGKPFGDPHSDWHRLAHDALGDVYALIALARGVTRTHRSRILFTLLRASRVELSNESRALRDRVTNVLLAALPADDVLAVFLALRKVRANHKHATRAVLGFVERHPDESLFTERRGSLRAILEHALGRDVARGIAKHLATRSDEGLRYIHDATDRFVRDPERLIARLATIHGGRALAKKVERPDLTEALDRLADRPKTVTATNRGEVASLLVHIYRGGGGSREITEGLEEAIVDAAAKLPEFGGKLTLIVDASLSTRGIGEREFTVISQSWALAKVLARRVPKLTTILVGGHGDPPTPEGATDLTAALLGALEGDPDVIGIVTDGYENRLAGDLARVLATLPRAGIEVPVVVCTSMFTAKDDLTLRVPAPGAPRVGFWHEEDFPMVLEALGGAARGEAGRQFILRSLGRRLEEMEALLA